MKYNCLSLCIAVCMTTQIQAQGSVEDYRRAFDAQHRFSADQMYYAPVEAHWIGETHFFWYKNHTPEGDRYMVVNADECTRSELFDTYLLAKELEQKSGHKVNGDHLVLNRLEINAGRDTLMFQFGGSRWSYDVKNNRLQLLGQIPDYGPGRHWMEVDDEKGWRPVKSPDGK